MVADTLESGLIRIFERKQKPVRVSEGIDLSRSIEYSVFHVLSVIKITDSLTRTLLVGVSLACLEMSFVIIGPGAVILLFRLEYKTSNVYTQKVKIARRDRPHILASNRCETFENLLRIDIAAVLFQGFYTRKIER